MRRFFRFVFLLLLIAIIGGAGFYFWAKSPATPAAMLTAEHTYTDAPARTYTMTADTLTVMTYNVGYLSGMTNNLPQARTESEFTANLQAAIAIIDQVQPDILGVQEIDFGASRSFGLDQLDAIAQAIPFRHTAQAVNWNKNYIAFPYWPLRVQFGRVVSGQALLTQLPIFSHQRIVLERPANNPWYFDDFYIDRLIQVVKLQIGMDQMVVLNVHLEAFDQRTREIQAERVLNVYRSYKDDFPVLLIGDFNAPTPDGLASADLPTAMASTFVNDRTIDILLQEPSLREAFTDSIYALHGTDAFTYSSVKPEVKIDHIFYNHDRIRPLEAYVPRFSRQPSDHKAVVMRFTVKPPAAADVP